MINVQRRPKMKMRSMAFIAIAVVSSQFAMADASYEKSSQITGGQFVDMLKNMPIISKQMKSMTEPTSTITMVHGNQKAVVNKDSTEISDLDKQVIIRIDNTKKTYTVTTFADFRKMMAEMPQRMAQMQQQVKDAQAKAQQQQGQGPAIPPNLQFNFTTNVTDPGPSKVINGQNAVQQIVTMKMTVTDTNNPATNVAYTVTTEVWTTPDLPAEMKEVEDFDKRFYTAMMAGVDMKEMMANMQNMRNGSSAAMAQMFGGKPGAAEAFAQMQKELAKIKGTRILEIQRMGGTGTGIAAAPPSGTNGAPAAPPSSAGSVAGQVASDTATNTAAGEAGRVTGSSIPGNALAGALMNAWSKHKAKPAAPPPPPPPPPAAAAPAASAPVDVTLMEMTTQTKDFSRESIPMSIFQIPAGYKQVPSPTEQMMAK
jgi:hypothetical protein